MKELPSYTTFIVTLPESSGNDEVLAKSTFKKNELVRKIKELNIDSPKKDLIDFEDIEYLIKTHWTHSELYKSYKPCEICGSINSDEGNLTEDIELLLVCDISSNEMIDLRSKKALQILAKFLKEIDPGPKTHWCICEKCFKKLGSEAEDEK